MVVPTNDSKNKVNTTLKVPFKKIRPPQVRSRKNKHNILTVIPEKPLGTSLNTVLHHETKDRNQINKLKTINKKNNEILDYGKENVLEFIQTTIHDNNNVQHDILDKIKYVLGEVIEGELREDYSSQGFYYERLWDLCIKFGATNLTLPAIKGKLQRVSSNC